MVNTQVVVSASLSVVLLNLVRTLEWTPFLCCIAAPAALYALLAEKTKATKLAGKTVLVTGSSSGLGLAMAQEVAKRGAAKVVLMSRTRPKLEAAAELCKAAAKKSRNQGPFEAVVVPCDVTKPDAVREAVKALPPIDVLVNNAGAGAWKHVEETTPEEGIEMMGCPYQSAFAMTTLLVPTMIPRAKDCHVLNVTSAASSLGFRGAVGYGTARWAMRGFSRMLLHDLNELGIGVTHLNAAEITGTDYFKDAPGKAGGSSKAKIPALFQLVDKLGLNYSTHQVAAAALNGVERGWSTVNVPGYVMIPTMMIYNIIPCFVEFLCSCGSAGLRKKAA
mmetsp:Transcript_20676/g.41989  ORF Transcript_20676/g.41989 Transcript_20676/m.41989 type:complete len:334 (-) Transcript_20676:47-1048(-)